MARRRFSLIAKTILLILVLAMLLTACSGRSDQTIFPEEYAGDWYLPPQIREDVYKDKADIGISEFKISTNGVLLVNDMKYQLTETKPGIYSTDDNFYVVDLQADNELSYLDKEGLQHDYQGITLQIEGAAQVFLRLEDLREISSLTYQNVQN